MFSCCSDVCFAGESAVDAWTKETVPHNVQILRRTRVVFTPDTPLKQLLAPIDLFPFCFRHYMSWPLFFNYDIDFEQLVEALHTVAQKYTLLCGRLSKDSQGRYVIEVGLTKGKKYDFPVVEVKADMPMAEGILSHGQITTDSADFPIHPDKLPFFMEPLDIQAIHKGYDPFLTVKLTHFSDGCCLAISICHFLVDGGRFSELYQDISRAYRGQEVHMRDINRQCMMFEELSKRFSPEDKEDCIIPKTMPTGREPHNLKQYPGESSSFEMLYLSKQVIDDLKLRVAQFIPKGSFVSTADLMQALLWMLGCELNTDCGEITDSTDLGIVGTQSVYNVELLMNGLGIIPPNYFGNGLLVPSIHAGSEINSKSLIKLLASLALLTRQRQIELRKQPKEVFKLLVGLCSPLTSFSDSFRASVSNGCKLSVSEADFGEGAPALFFRLVLLPLTGSGWFVTPVFQTEGILIGLLTTTKQKERLKRSQVLKECAPGVKSLFDDFGVADLIQLMKQQRCGR